MELTPLITNRSPIEQLEEKVHALFHQYGDIDLDKNECSQRDKDLMALFNFHSQVCNGGIEQWHENGYYDTQASAVLDALQHLPKSTSQIAVELLVAQAIRCIANDDGQEAEGHGSLSNESYEALDYLTDKYYAVYNEFWPAVTRYFL